MSGSRIAWGAVLLGALGLYLFENNAGTRALLAVAVLLPVFSALALYLPRCRVTAALTLPDTLRRGEAAEGTLTLKNAGKRPLRQALGTLTLENAMTGERETVLLRCRAAAGRSTKVDFTLKADHCGCVTVRLASLTLSDALGLFSRRLDAAAEAEACVRPEIYPLAVSLAETGDFLADSQRYSAQKAGYDPSETFRIREYVPGDPIRQIHWKLSEKTGKVLVRELGLPIVDRMLLLVETSGTPEAPLTPEAMDGMLDLAFSLSQALLAQDIAHTVGWRDAEDFAACEIEAPSDLRTLALRLGRIPLRSVGASAASALLARDARVPWAHAALIAPGQNPDMEALQQGNRVTALLPAGVSQTGLTSGVETIFSTPAVLRDGALQVEL